MTHNTSPQAATRREQSRQVDGRFGFQHHSEADISLSSRGLTEELRQAIMANQPLVQLDTRGDDEPTVILENPQNYSFTVGEYADWAVATDEEVRRYEDHHNQLYDQEMKHKNVTTRRVTTFKKNSKTFSHLKDESTS